jgi:hypothetical protein
MEKKMNYKEKLIQELENMQEPKNPIIYEKSFVVYSFDKDLTIEDINKVLKDMNVSARELTDDEVIYQI